MYVANATGCSSIWGGPAATSPYAINKDGHGPAWSNSLFEDNAEHGLGMLLGHEAVRDKLVADSEKLLASGADEAAKAAARAWIDSMGAAGGEQKEASQAYIAELERLAASDDAAVRDGCSCRVLENRNT